MTVDIPEQVRVPFVPSAARTARIHLSAFLSQRRLAQPVVDDALVVISELVSNAVRHATPQDDGELGVSWALEREQLLLVVEDGGSVRTPQEISTGPSGEGGRGLSIVSVLSRRWWVETRERGVRVTAQLDTLLGPPG